VDEIALPDAWCRLFDGSGLDDKLSASALLATVDGESWPHVSFLSAGEVLVPVPDRVVLTVWAQSAAAANMRQGGRAALFAAADGMVVEARLAVLPGAADDSGRAIFVGRPERLRPHRAPYAEVEGLIAFRLLDPAATLDRWRTQIATMRGAG
jgi:hypothetical protein